MTGNNSSLNYEPQSGYDLPIYGLHNGTFYFIHIPAIVCMFSSLICAIIAITLSFKRQSYSVFFTRWSKSNRFVVYLAMCDGIFNVCHLMDHLHVTIIKTHVLPKELCAFYGFNLIVVITAQNLIVNVMAINAFMLMYFEKPLNFGKWDWKLLIWAFGTPFVGAVIAGILGQFGPTGAFCLFDGVTGNIANLCFTTSPLLIVLFINIVLYVLTWNRISKQTKTIAQTLGHMTASMKTSRTTARSMTLFVAAFFVQWWALAVGGIWGLITPNVPQAVFHLMTVFSNIGGVLNLTVYLNIRQGQRAKVGRASERTYGSRFSRSQRVTNIEELHPQDVSVIAEFGAMNANKDTVPEHSTHL